MIIMLSFFILGLVSGFIISRLKQTKDERSTRKKANDLEKVFNNTMNKEIKDRISVTWHLMDDPEGSKKIWLVSTPKGSDLFYEKAVGDMGRMKFTKPSLKTKFKKEIPITKKKKKSKKK